MKILYSASLGGFYLEGVNASVPTDAVEITAAKHRQLLEAQAIGATISADTLGRPKATMPAAPSPDQQRAQLATSVKAEAGMRILAVAPIWRQSNDNAALAQELMNRINGVASSPELAAEVADALVRRTWIDAIRAASEMIEAGLQDLEAAQLVGFQVSKDPRWPEFED